MLQGAEGHDSGAEWFVENVLGKHGGASFSFSFDLSGKCVWSVPLDVLSLSLLPAAPSSSGTTVL